jgi:Ferritin-like domain
MAANRIMRDGGGACRLGPGARRALLAAAILAVAALLAACGGGGGDDSGTAAAEKAADGEILNEVLSRQEGAVLAYADALRGIDEPFLPIARGFQAQEEEHADATLRALRVVGEPAEPEAEEIPRGPLRDEADYLRFLYELESATIEEESSAVVRLTSVTARTILTATIANQAQHLVLLRRALGAKAAETVPEAFENGTATAP